MKFTTYNVGLLDVWLLGKKIFEFAPHTRLRADLLIGTLVKLETDVIFLQELYRQDDMQAIFSALSSKFPYTCSSKSRWGGKLLGHGLAILSKYPLTHSIDTTYSQQLLDERMLGPKGYLSVLCVLPNTGEILLTNTHTTAGGLFQHPEGRKTDRCREAQLSELLSHCKTNKCSIIAGDLNCGPDVSKDNFDILVTSGFHRPENELAGFSDQPTWDPKNPLNINGPHRTSPPQRIDHILFSGDLMNRFAVRAANFEFTEQRELAGASLTLSDHYGFTVDFTEA